MKSGVSPRQRGWYESARGAVRAARRVVSAKSLKARARSLLWARYSRLVLVSDSPLWVLEGEMRELELIARQLGIRSVRGWHPVGVSRQAVFYASKYALLERDIFHRGNRIAVSYFHGQPSEQEPEFVACYEALKRNHERVERVQVSHSAMRESVLGAGVAPKKVFLIRIGLNPTFFPIQTQQSRLSACQEYGLPESAVIVGSFQKDGVGWGDGMQPKLIKGPDVFLRTVALLKERVPELFVLLTGPARGYVKAGLEQAGIPYRHFYVRDYAEVGRLFQALDLYLVTSREEGGPKAVLESMASGVPLVTTRVGQAMDLVEHGRNGWMVEVGDVGGLAHWAEHALRSRSGLEDVLRHARQTAEANTYAAQLPQWRQFFDGFVER